MPILTRDQLTTYAQQAGFTGDNVQTIVAISLAESGGNTDAVNPNDPNGGSFGVLQINAIHFGHGTTRACALDPACAFRYAYTLSGGTNFNAWSTFTSGLYKQFLGVVSAVAKAWYDYTPIEDFGEKFSWATYPVQGIDIPMPQDTPITAALPGTISSMYYDAGGGQVIIKEDQPLFKPNIPYYYYVHLDQFAPQLAIGSHVVGGQLVGYSGGQTSGGSHPAAPNYSSGPHLEIGVAKTNAIPYRSQDITPDLQPDWLLTAARAYGALIQSVANIGSNPLSDTLGQLTSFFGNISDFLNKIAPWVTNPIRVIKLMSGMMIVGLALFLLANPEFMETEALTRLFKIQNAPKFQPSAAEKAMRKAPKPKVPKGVSHGNTQA